MIFHKAFSLVLFGSVHFLCNITVIISIYGVITSSKTENVVLKSFEVFENVNKIFMLCCSVLT